MLDKIENFNNRPNAESVSDIIDTDEEDSNHDHEPGPTGNVGRTVANN